MISAKKIFNHIVKKIVLKISRTEIDSLAYRLLQATANITKTDVVAEKKVTTPVDWNTINGMIDRINRHEPIQYILGKQEFYGRDFYITPDVLVPRAETETLIDETISLLKEKAGIPVSVLDIGTGSGCIPITLALELEGLKIYALDKSKAALGVARHNATHYGVDLKLYLCDILHASLPPTAIDLIVSNPPYVQHSEKASMQPSVLYYEPHEALFAPENAPLLFYSVLATKCKDVLKKGGSVVVEINEQFGEQVVTLFQFQQYQSVKLIKDNFGKDRIVRATYDGNAS